MAAVWAFCVGVQAEDMGCWPSPSRALMRTTHHGLPNTSQGSAHGGFTSPGGNHAMKGGELCFP